MLMSRSGVVNQNTTTDTQSIMNATTTEITRDDQNLLETGEPKKNSEVNLENINETPKGQDLVLNQLEGI